VAIDAKPEVAEYRINWLSATGTSIFTAAVFSAIWMGVAPFVFAASCCGQFSRCGMRY
jgi:hypothetical protein